MLKRSVPLAFAGMLILISPVYADDVIRQTDDELADAILDSLPPPAKSIKGKKAASKVLKALCAGAAGYCAVKARQPLYSPIIIQPTYISTPAPQLPQMHSFSSTRIGDTVHTFQYY